MITKLWYQRMIQSRAVIISDFQYIIIVKRIHNNNIIVISIDNWKKSNIISQIHLKLRLSVFSFFVLNVSDLIDQPFVLFSLCLCFVVVQVRR